MRWVVFAGFAAVLSFVSIGCGASTGLEFDASAPADTGSVPRDAVVAACGASACSAGQICVRTDSSGGAPMPCDSGTGICSVMTTTFECRVRPPACPANGPVVCSCAGASFCTGGCQCVENSGAAGCRCAFP